MFLDSQSRGLLAMTEVHLAVFRLMYLLFMAKYENVATAVQAAGHGAEVSAPRHAAAAASLSDLLGGDLLGDGDGATPPQPVRLH